MTTTTPEGSSEAPTQESMREMTRNVERISGAYENFEPPVFA